MLCRLAGKARQYEALSLTSRAMSQENAYAMTDDGLLVAAAAPATERAIFLKKTYGLLLMAILVFAGTMVATFQVPALKEMAWSLAGNFWLPLILMMGGAWLVHALAEKPGINLITFYAYAIFFGFLVAPWVHLAGGSVVLQASLLTAFIFIGLSAYVFFSGKDFGFMGGFLYMAMFGLLGVGLVGFFMDGGYTMRLWLSAAGALLFSGFILYDTSNILRRYPTTMHVSAACVLFVDIVLLFRNLIFLLMDRD